MNAIRGGEGNHQSQKPTMQINPYLFFDGNCEEALKFYAQCLGGNIQALFTYAGSPAEAHVPPEPGGKILHATLVVGDQVLQASDCPPGRFEPPKGFCVSIQI